MMDDGCNFSKNLLHTKPGRRTRSAHETEKKERTSLLSASCLHENVLNILIRARGGNDEKNKAFTLL